MRKILMGVAVLVLVLAFAASAQAQVTSHAANDTFVARAVVATATDSMTARWIVIGVGSETTELLFPAIGAGDTFVKGISYLAVSHGGNRLGWGVRIYVDNFRDTASPRANLYESGPSYQYAPAEKKGLVAVEDTSYGVSLKWSVLPDSGTGDPADYSAADVTDVNFWRWMLDHTVDTQLTNVADNAYATFCDAATVVERTRANRIYFAGGFEGVPAATYRTSTLTIDLYSQ